MNPNAECDVCHSVGVQLRHRFFLHLQVCLLLTVCSVAGVDGFSHPPPALPTDRSFDSLFEEWSSFMFGSEEDSGQGSTAELQDRPGYQVSLSSSVSHTDQLLLS